MLKNIFKKKKQYIDESIDISGKWIGYYRFKNTFAKEVKIFNIKFEAELNSDGSIIKGVIIEDIKSGGIPDKARLVGEFKNNKLLFKKTYSAQYLIDMNNKLIRNENKKSQVIKYKGELDLKYLKFTGRWHIDFVFIPVTSGYWEMTKEEE